MSDPAALSLIVVVMLLLASGGLALVLYIRMRLSAVRQGRIEADGDGERVPLVAAFSGWKGIPWLTHSSSNLKPTLILRPDHIECRVIRTRRKRYRAVSRIDYREGIGTNNVVLEFSDSRSSFIGNTASRELARDVILRLARRGCPLSTRAQALLDGGSDEGGPDRGGLDRSRPDGGGRD
ncbi:hypothetical protein [Azospirillum sp. B506]|uniref:hypothetical protein n=1 Tax=Azospirillum sp. B506 TaxID=137721 RepID=UPI00034B0E69|nr:hypothetical protein [Azospirillum sp. B506]